MRFLLILFNSSVKVNKKPHVETTWGRINSDLLFVSVLTLCLLFVTHQTDGPVG